MKKLLKKTLIFIVRTICLVITFLLITTACDKTKATPNGDTPSISGTWEVKAIRISDELTTIDSPPDNAHFSNISIIIPNVTQGHITGNTFKNSIGFHFEIKEQQQILFKNYGGTRLAEDSWGRGFADQISFNVVKFDISNNELQFIDSLDNIVILFIKGLNKD
jgi:hypothetical protein